MEFARLNPPRNGEGDHSREDGNGGGVGATLAPATALEEAEAGMAQMSERYRESGDLYVPVDEPVSRKEL